MRNEITIYILNFGVTIGATNGETFEFKKTLK